MPVERGLRSKKRNRGSEATIHAETHSHEMRAMGVPSVRQWRTCLPQVGEKKFRFKFLSLPSEKVKF